MWSLIEDYLLTLRGILAYRFELRKSCYRPIEVVREEQFSKLKYLLSICATQVPYYKALFDRIGFDVTRDFRTLDDLRKIPITTKDAVKNNPQLFINPDYAGKALAFHTSGSSGQPLVSYVSKNQWVIEQAAIWRHWSWAGYRFRDKMAIVRSYVPKNGKLIRHDWIRNFRYYSPFDLSDANIKVYLEDMIRQKVVFLRGYPTSIKPIALYVLRNNCPIPGLKAVLTASETLHDSDRALIERAFKCKIFNHYGMAEGTVLMGDCECHKGLHNYDEYGYAEYIDTDNPSIKKLIATNLNNYAMPLIRYDTNDLVEISDEKCACQRSSRIIRNVIGRLSDVIHLKDRAVPLVNFYTMMETYTAVKQWQIVRSGPQQVELRINGDITKEEQNEIEAGMRSRLPDYVHISVCLDKPLIQKREGKIPSFLSL